MALLLVLQIALPLVLLGWLALTPAASIVGLGLQILGTALCLAALGLTGLWMFPPWWMAYVWGGAGLLAAGLALFRHISAHPAHPVTTRTNTCTSTVPVGGLALGAALFFAVLSLTGGYLVTHALAGRAPSSALLAQQVDLAFPLATSGAGTYLVVNGGYDTTINAHLKTLDTTQSAFAAWRGQSYGVDIVKINALGLRATGVQPAEPQAYLIYGTPVLAPCDGWVVVVVDGLPDMPVPQVDRVHLAGNHVLLRCERADVLLGHLKPGSLQVKVGAPVRLGQVVGAVGNSGNTGEPHLHIHAQQPGTAQQPFSGNPLALKLAGRNLSRNDRVNTP